MINEIGNDFTLRAKTGWSQSEGLNNGWFVGYLETKEQGTIVFAVNIQRPQSESSDGFASARKKILMNIFKQLKYI